MPTLKYGRQMEDELNWFIRDTIGDERTEINLIRPGKWDPSLSRPAQISFTLFQSWKPWRISRAFKTIQDFHGKLCAVLAFNPALVVHFLQKLLGNEWPRTSQREDVPSRDHPRILEYIKKGTISTTLWEKLQRAIEWILPTGPPYSTFFDADNGRKNCKSSINNEILSLMDFIVSIPSFFKNHGFFVECGANDENSSRTRWS